MPIDEKKRYIIKLLIWIGLIQEKIIAIWNELDAKEENELDEIIMKLEQYYLKQDILDKEFIKNLEKINNQIDESIDSTIEKFRVESFSF